MSRGFLHRCALWLLPLLALRALLPLGFMPTLSSNGLELRFCPTQAPTLAAALNTPLTLPASASEHAYHGADHHHSAGEGEHTSHTGASPCPYALAASVVLPAFDALNLVAGTVEQSITFELDAPPADSRAARAHLIRGPPSLS